MYSVPQSDNNQTLLYSISHDNVLNKNDMSTCKHFCTFTEIFISEFVQMEMLQY